MTTMMNSVSTEANTAEALDEIYISILNDCIPSISTQDLKLISEDIQKYVLSTGENKADIKDSLFESYPNAQLILSELREIFHVLMKGFRESGLIAEGKNLGVYEKNLCVHEILRQLTYCLFQRLECYTAGLDIDLITALSSTAYESKSLEGETLAILPSLEYFEKNYLVKFNPSDRVTLEQPQIRALRKQLNICGKGALAVYKDYEEGIYKTAGLISRDAALELPRFHFQKHAEWIFAVNNSAGSDVSCLREEDGSRLRYCNGTLMLPFLDLQKVYCKQLNTLPTHEKNKEKLARIINALNECKHGAILVIADEEIIDTEVDWLSSNKRGTRLTPPVSLVPKEDEVSSPILKQLAAVDGAIFLKFNGECHAFGVILDGEVTSSGNNARGSRYNSTKTYVEWIRELEAYHGYTILGVVKSEDGMIDLFE